MNGKEITAESVWKEYTAGEDYFTQIKHHETIKENERFFNGDQWKGVNAPDIQQPVINVFHPAIAYYTAQLVSDDVGIDIEPFCETEERARECRILSDEIDRIIERTKAKSKSREIVRDAAIDKAGIFYFYFDPNIGKEGEIEIEVFDNDKFIVANPFERELQKQKYIILVKRMKVCDARERAKELGASEADITSIQPDSAYNYSGENKDVEQGLCTIIMRFWKESGRVWFCESAQSVMLKQPTETMQRFYPVAYFGWEKTKDSFYGAAAMTPYIPNQRFINKMWAMAGAFCERMAFPTRFYDSTKLKGIMTNKAGQAIGIAGAPRDAVWVDSPAGNFSDQVIMLIEKTQEYIKNSMGITDAALGNMKIDNASAIIALAEQSRAPLEMQKLGFHQFWEDSVNVIIGLICEFEKVKTISEKVTDDEGNEVKIETEFDFSAIDPEELSLNVNIGDATRWSEITAIQTADALFKKGIITDAITYLESLPKGYVRNETEIIKRLEEQKAMQEQLLMAQQAAPAADPTAALPIDEGGTV